MQQFFNTDNLLKKFKTHSLIAGILLLLAGLVGIFFPGITSLTLSYFIGWLLVIGGTINAYHTIKSYNTKWIAWFKPVILVIIGILLLLYPLTGVAAIGLLLVIYFFMDGFAGILFGLEFKPYHGWIWMVLNGIISFILAGLFLIGWPFSSIWLVGLFVGISLFFDGITMIIVGFSIKK